MNFKSEYLQEVYDSVEKRSRGEGEFLQAVAEVLESLEPIVKQRSELRDNAILERFTEPERAIVFRVPWIDDAGRIRVNRGFRIQFNSAIGPYKGGLRFHPSVNMSVMKFLGFEQTLKNAQTGLPMGGAKGGSDFDPKGKSEREIMHFCQSFMTELSRHIGCFTDVPAGDIGVGMREIGYMFGQYKRLKNSFEGVLTGKAIVFGGSLGRTEATGYGLCYFLAEMLNFKGTDFRGKTVAVSGSGNVAFYACQKASELGAKVVTMSDSDGFIHDPDGIKADVVEQIKFVRRGRIGEYADIVPQSSYIPGKKPWRLACDIALPCATQNELDLDDAKMLVANGCRFVAEGANMPCSPGAIKWFLQNDVFFGPAKAANAGGVTVSGLEMCQNSERICWSFEKVDAKLREIMAGIFANALAASERYGEKGNLVMGANIAGFEKIAAAMLAQGVAY